MNSNFGVHDFAIPHEHVRPTRDMIIIRLPLPPKFVGDKVKFEVPDFVRDMAQHNVMAGRIVAMGPLAFSYKEYGEEKKHEAAIGDWVVIRPYAGTLVQGGQIRAEGGWRYVSSFADVLAVVPKDKMPDADTLLWEDKEAAPAFDYRGPPQKPGKDDFNFANKK